MTDDLDQIAASIAHPEDWTWAFDFDGTISEIVAHPDEATPIPGVKQALTRLAAATEVAIVSGRGLDDLADRVGSIPVALIGSHGAEVRLLDGHRHTLLDDWSFTDGLEAVAAELDALVERETGWIVERKPASVAVHYRQVEPGSVEPMRARISELLASAADDDRFEFIRGKALLELRAEAASKDLAIEWLAKQTPGKLPIAFGDDTTDEDAFRAAQSLGGSSVLISPHDCESAAQWRLSSPDRVVTLILSVL